MFLETRMMFIYVETPLHAGAGSGVEAIDLPIQRERTTGYPMVQAPGIKGALRSEVKDAKANKALVKAVFGADAGDDNLHAGAFSPGDARLLLFPVRSLKGVFAWTTCLDALHRWRREALAAGFDEEKLPALPAAEPGENECYAAGDGALADGVAVLEEFAFTNRTEPNVAKLAAWLALYALPAGAEFEWWREGLKKRLIVLSNDDFRDFTLHATEVLTRIRLVPDTKTVQQGALWTEEHLPPESLLYAPARATRLRVNKDDKPDALKGGGTAEGEAAAVLDWIGNADNIPHRFQLGGDETVGRGLVSLRWLKAGDVKEVK